MHIPNNSDVTLFHALSSSQVPTCNLEVSLGGLGALQNDGLKLPCDCQNENCMRASNVAVQERSHDNYHLGGWADSTVAWFAMLRDPETWFYSAVAQWCGDGPGSGAGRQEPECGHDVSVALLHRRGWFTTKAIPTAEYFRGPNPQRAMANFTGERCWALCSVENFGDALALLEHALPWHTSDSSPRPEHMHAGVWPGKALFQQRVPWHRVRHYYAVDVDTYNFVTGRDGCVASSRGDAACPWAEGLAQIHTGGDLLDDDEHERLLWSSGFQRTVTMWVRGLKLPRGEPVVLVFINIDYWGTYINWLSTTAQHMGSALSSRVATACFDVESIARLEEIGASPCLNVKASTNNERWAARLRLIKELLHSGHGVILSDADALWIGDAREFYYKGIKDGSDIVASRATFPAEVQSAWGATLCMGFIAFQPSAANRALLGHVVHACGDRCDDQMVLNKVLLHSAQLRWNTTVSDNGPTAMGVGDLDNQKLSVTLLTSHAVRRQCSQPIRNMSVVMHCRSRKSGVSKEEEEKENHSWRLRPSWDQVARKPPLLEYLQAVTTAAHTSPHPPSPPSCASNCATRISPCSSAPIACAGCSQCVLLQRLCPDRYHERRSAWAADPADCDVAREVGGFSDEDTLWLCENSERVSAGHGPVCLGATLQSGTLKYAAEAGTAAASASNSAHTSEQHQVQTAQFGKGGCQSMTRRGRTLTIACFAVARILALLPSPPHDFNLYSSWHAYRFGDMFKGTLRPATLTCRMLPCRCTPDLFLNT